MTPPRLQIGEWRANRTTNELGRAGDTVRIEPKVMEVLMVLADRAGEVVSRDDLLAAVWPGVVVGDDALTQSIIKLRKALGDNPRSPSYIETISKRGYRLIAPVVRNDAVPATHDEREPAPPESAGFSSSWHPFAGDGGGHCVGFDGGRFLFLRLTIAATAGSARSRRCRRRGQDRVAERDGAAFRNGGRRAEQGYLARGISSDLMTDLSRLSGLRLISASGNTASDHAASTARYVVSGSVQRDGATCGSTFD